MKTMIVVLAVVGGVGLGVATHAMAADSTNLSCITEVDAAGNTIRDCNKDHEPIVYAQVVDDEAGPDAPVPLAIHEGGKKSDDARR